MENCCRIKNGNGRLALEEVKARRIWKEYFKDLNNTNTQEQVSWVFRSDLHPKAEISREKSRDKKCRVYMGFMDLEKAYDRVNKVTINR